MEIINHDSDRVGISGEAGCGKTLVLLALLYSKAGKHLKDASLLKNKVLFLMQEGKTEFRKYVDGFVRDFCHSDRVAVLWLKEFQTFTREDASAEFDLILVDEFYLGQLEIVVQALEEIDCRCKCFMVIPPLSNAFYTLENGSEWSYFSLQKSYRCPVNIALRCAKLRRKATFDEIALTFCMYFNVASNFCYDFLKFSQKLVSTHQAASKIYHSFGGKFKS